MFCFDIPDIFFAAIFFFYVCVFVCLQIFIFRTLFRFGKDGVLNGMINSSFEFSFAVANQFIRTMKISFSLLFSHKLDIWNFLPFLAENFWKSTSILILRFTSLFFYFLIVNQLYIWPRFPAFMEPRKPCGAWIYCYKEC